MHTYTFLMGGGHLFGIPAHQTHVYFNMNYLGIVT